MSNNFPVEALSQHLWRGPEEITENLSEESVRTEIRNRHLPNLRPDIYLYTTLLAHGKNFPGKPKMKQIVWKIYTLKSDNTVTCQVLLNTLPRKRNDVTVQRDLFSVLSVRRLYNEDLFKLKLVGSPGGFSS
jgi:hypothetical protein